MKIPIGPNLTIREEEIHLEFIRSSGPGGQNVNKVATAVQLRFDVARSPSLPEDVRRRLTALAGKRLTKEGHLVIEARRFRTQESNRRDAVNRLVALIGQALQKPKVRRMTKPSPSARERRLAEKKRTSAIKRLRRLPRRGDLSCRADAFFMGWDRPHFPKPV